MKPAGTILNLTILIISIYVSYAWSDAPDAGVLTKETRLLMGTTASIIVWMGPSGSRETALAGIRKAFDEIKRVETVFSPFIVDSEISRLNRSLANIPLKTSPEVFALLKISSEYNKKTGGAFDITIKPLADLWRKSSLTMQLPGRDELDIARSRTGSRYMKLNDKDLSVSFMKGGMAIDMGGVAKGYAADRAMLVLKDGRARNAIINLGGDMYCMGRRGESPWKIGIQDPRRSSAVLMEVELEDAGCATSGDYEKYFILNGRRYLHIIDPGTGYPVGDDIVSATVIAKDSMTADILATSLVIMGERGLDIVSSVAGAAAIIIKNDKGKLNVVMSEGMKERYHVKKK